MYWRHHIRWSMLITPIIVLLVYLEMNTWIRHFDRTSSIRPSKHSTSIFEIKEEPTKSEHFTLSRRDELTKMLDDPIVTPKTVYYVWCGRKWFQFHNYVSMRSVIKAINPDKIVFFCEHKPIVDARFYNTWFQEILDTFPFIQLEAINEKNNPCDRINGSVKKNFLWKLLLNCGGMYVHENTVIVQFPSSLRKRDSIDGLEVDTGQGFFRVNRAMSNRRPRSDVLYGAGKSSTLRVHCANATAYATNTSTNTVCINIDAVFYPKDIWELQTPFGDLVRQIFYGSPDVRKPVQSFDILAPNIAHVVWLGGGPMDYLFYLCVLSLIYVAEVDMVYIHGDSPPTGRYWDQVKHHERIKLVYREHPRYIYGEKVDVVSHVSDIWRVDFMVKYGGIYVDTDAVFVKPLDREMRSYDAVASFDWTDWDKPFPDTINFGVTVGKRNATFWREFQRSMKDFRDDDWSWNGLRQPYKILERNPELVRIDPRLQVICFRSLCHPTWWPGYWNKSVHHLNSASITNWTKDTFAFHWTAPTPTALLDDDRLMASETMFAEIGKYILEKAGRLD